MGRQTMVGIADLPYVIGCTPSRDDPSEAAVDDVSVNPTGEGPDLRGGDEMG